MGNKSFIIGPNDPILVTGATGFIGSAVIQRLLRHGFRNLYAFVRPSSNSAFLDTIGTQYPEAQLTVIRGNLVFGEDCATVRDMAVIIHLAAGTGEKSFAGAFLNSVVTTRNLLEAATRQSHLRRFVNVSSISVYANRARSWGKPLDESCPLEVPPHRHDAYCFAKIKQEEVVTEYANRFGIPHVTVRPGSVYGPGKAAITGRAGIDTFGVFLHLGGGNSIPLTYVANCAEAIVLAGLMPGVDGEVFNVVDDDLPSSRYFLRLYKRHVRRFHSIYIPHLLSYALCSAWEKYSSWSQGQLPPAFTQDRWYADWKRTRYSNRKIKERLGWLPRIPMEEGLLRYFEACRKRVEHA